jgi:hypothetical protein
MMPLSITSSLSIQAIRRATFSFLPLAMSFGCAAISGIGNRISTPLTLFKSALCARKTA